MKKSLVFFVALAALVLSTVSCEQKPGLGLDPSEVTLKVGETTTLHPAIYGEGIDFNDVRVINYVEGEEDIAYMDNYYTVHAGSQTGTTKVGIAVFNKKKEDGTPDTDSGVKYSAYTIVHVVK